MGERGERRAEAEVGAKKGTFSVFKIALKTRRGSLARVLGRIGVAGPSVRAFVYTREDATRCEAGRAKCDGRSDPIRRRGRARQDETVDEASRGVVAAVRLTAL